MNFKHDITLGGLELHCLNACGGVSPNMALGQMPSRPALLIKLVDNDSCFGWGEVWSNFPPRANQHKAHLIEDVVKTHLIGARFANPVELTDFLRTKLSVYFLHIGQSQVFEHILAGLDTAAWDLCLRSRGQSFASFMNIEPVAACYASSLNAEDLDRRLAKHIALGQREFKLKIGFDEDSDVAFVGAAFEKLPKGARLMIDSNQSWDLAAARRILQRLEAFDLLFAEEPIGADCPLQDWEALAQSTPIALAGGENLYGVAQFVSLANAGMRIAQPDVAKWGGVSGALALARALPKGCKLWPHFMGSAVGQQAGFAISAAVGASSKCELDVNENMLRTDLCLNTAPVINGKITLANTAGLLVPPAQDSLARFAARFATQER